MSESGNIVQSTETQVTQEKEPDLRDDVAYALHDIQSRETETPEQTEARRRDEQGRFVKAEPEAQAKERKTLTLPAAAPIARAEGQHETSLGAPAVKVPDTWSAEGKAVFPKLDPIAQKEIAKRENDVMRALTVHDEYRTLGRRIAEESAPYMHIIRAEGGDETLAYKNFLNYAYIVRQGSPQQKAGAIAQLMQTFQIPLQAIAQFYNVGDGQYPQQAPDPVYSRLNDVDARQQRIEQRLEQEDQFRQQQEQVQLVGEIAEFAKTPDHEHFEKVRELMGIYLETGQAEDLEQAYDKAIWATPEIRTTLTAQQGSQAQAQRQTAVEAAKRAAGSVSGGPGGAKISPQANGQERSLEDEIRANMRAALGRI